MNYQEAVNYILEIPKFTEKHTLSFTKDFLRRLGNPAASRKFIHVAGTNGKGSVCAYLQALLLAEGKQTGFFTSPHLVKLNERIRLNGREVDDETFLKAFHQVLRVVEEGIERKIPHPTYFEFLFGLGMLIFEEQDMEYIILETGLGGRLDATNIVEHPLLTIITSISLDHTEILGDTIGKIAMEKAGIIKPGIPVIFDGLRKESSEVIKSEAVKKQSPCREISKNAYEITEIAPKDIAFLMTNAYYENTIWHLEGYGVFQVANAALALEAMQIIGKETGKHLELWKKTLQHVVWEGRMEEVLPDVIVDGAHNMGAIQAFTRSVNELQALDKKRLILLFSVVQEKSYKEMISYLVTQARPDLVIVTHIEDSRAVDTDKLSALFQKSGSCNVVVIDDIRAAFEQALREKGEDGRVCCLGSLYLAGKIKEIL